MKSATLACALLWVCSNAAACDLPALAAIPEKTADDVTGVLRDVRRYSDSMVEYTACIQAELAAAGGDAAPAFQRAVLIRRNNHAAAEHKALTDLYAERVGPLENLGLAEYLDAESRDCLIGSWIKRTGVVNDGAVIFFVRDEQAYLNVLEASCPGLAHDGEFFVGQQRVTRNGPTISTLQTPLTARVCDQDRIFPYREGSERRVLSCGLGRFFPISAEQGLQILARRSSPGSAPSEAGAR